MTKARDLANFVSTGNPFADGILAVADISDLTASAAELNELGDFAGTFTLPVSDGTANQYLKTDGSGNLSFGTVATEPFSNNAALAQVQATALCF
jgi:hypothetical protein